MNRENFSSSQQTIEQFNKNTKTWGIIFLIIGLLLIILLLTLFLLIINNQKKTASKKSVGITPLLEKPTKKDNQNITKRYHPVDEVIYSISRGELASENNRIFPQVDVLSLDLTTGKEEVIYSQRGSDFYLAEVKYFLYNNSPHLLINLETKLLIKNLLTKEIKTIFDTKNNGTIPRVLVSPSGDLIYFTIVHFYDNPLRGPLGAYTIYKYDLINKKAEVLREEKEGKEQTAKVPYKFSEDKKTIYYQQFFPAEGIFTFWQSDLNGNNFKNTNLTSLDIDNRMKDSKIIFFDSGKGMVFCGSMIENISINNSIKIGTRVILSKENTNYLFLKKLNDKFSLLQERHVIEKTGFGSSEENIVMGRKCGVEDLKSTKELIIDEVTGQSYYLPADDKEIKQINDFWYILQRDYSSDSITFSEYALTNGEISNKKILIFGIDKELKIISLIEKNQPSNKNYFEMYCGNRCDLFTPL